MTGILQFLKPHALKAVVQTAYHVLDQWRLNALLVRLHTIFNLHQQHVLELVLQVIVQTHLEISVKLRNIVIHLAILVT